MPIAENARKTNQDTYHKWLWSFTQIRVSSLFYTAHHSRGLNYFSHLPQQMDSHISDYCPLTEVTCPYAKAGCPFKVCDTEYITL